MTSLDDRLRTGITALAERIEPSAAPDDVVHALGARSPSSTGSRLALRVAVVAAVLLVAAASIALLRRSDDSHPVVDVGPATTTPAPRPEWHPTGLAPGWNDLPTSPLGPITPRAMVWTGNELIIWRSEGAAARGFDRAASYDAASGTWTELPHDPLGGVYLSGVGAGGAWTGSEALFWAPDGMVAWSPTSESWRTAAAPPSPTTRDGVWTGEEVIFWADGLAYRPATDTWRAIARPSEALVATVNDDADGLLWTGDQLVVVGALSGVYEPSTDSWDELGAPLAEEVGSPGIAFDGFTATVTTIDGKIVAFDASPSSAAVLDLDVRKWTEMPELTPLDVGSSPRIRAVPFEGGQVLFVPYDDHTTLRTAEGAWLPQAARSPDAVIGTGNFAFQYGSPLASEPFSIFIPPTQERTPPTTWDAAVLGSGWHELDRGPLPASPPRAVGVGDHQLFTFGFNSETDSDVADNKGFVLDVKTGSWTTVNASPLLSLDAMGAVWTGDAFLVWSTEGVALWHPLDQQWTLAEDPPRPLDRYPYWGGDGTWTGSEVVFWANGLTYDVAEDEWHEIPLPPSSPSRASAVFDGEEVIVVGLASEQIPRFTAEMALDVSTGRWRTLPPSGLDGQSLDLTVLRDGANRPTVLGVDYQNGAAVYDRSTDEWIPLGPIPMDTAEDGRTVAALSDGRAFVTSTGTGQALLGTDRQWSPIEGGTLGYVVAEAGAGVIVFGDRLAVFVP